MFYKFRDGRNWFCRYFIKEVRVEFVVDVWVDFVQVDWCRERIFCDCSMGKIFDQCFRYEGDCLCNKSGSFY